MYGQDIRRMINQVENFGRQLHETVYFHGTSLPKENPNIDKFEKRTGYRSGVFTGIITESSSSWTFFSEDVDFARKFGYAHTERHEDSGNRKNTTVILKYDIDESSLNILDLRTEDYETKLEKIGIKLWEMYGYGMYEQDQMWQLLDDEETSNIIVQAGFNAVKIFEDLFGNRGESLAIHIDKVNSVIKKIGATNGVDEPI